jgi:hypothetical protein
LFTAKLSEGKGKLENEDCIGAVSLVWNLAVALLLKDIIDNMKQVFDYDYPHLILLGTLRPRILYPD